MMLPVIWACVCLFSRVVANTCEESADLCVGNITKPDADITYKDMGLELYSPDKWAALCQEYKKQKVVSCLQEVLTSTSCSLVAQSQALVRDSITAVEFKCSTDALQVYASNWDCFRDQRFEQTWSNCQQTLQDKVNQIYAAILSTFDPVRLTQLLQDFCVSYEKYLLCTYSTSKVFCGAEMGEYMYQHEYKPMSNFLLHMGCSPPANISNLTFCDPQSARLCVSNTKSHIHALATSHNVQRMCHDITAVNSTFVTCYNDNTDGCQTGIKKELDVLLFPVTMAIEEVVDLCDQPVLPSEGDCDYTTLKQCENTLLSALDLEVKQLCSLRSSFYQNISICLDEYLVNCPSVTQKQYRDRQNEIQQLWWSSQSNHTCDLENECVDDFINRLDEMKKCFVSNATKESFEAICNDYQKSLHCLERLIDGCTPVVDALYREHVLDDLLESATFYDCNLTFNGVQTVTQKNDCNYRHILQCYSSFFSLIGIKRTNYLPYLHNLSNRFLQTVLEQPTTFCSSMSSTDLRRCLDTTLPQCANFTREKLGHVISSSSYQDVTYDSNKVLSYDFVMDIEYLCSAGCSNISHLLSAVNTCSLKHVSFLEITENVMYYKHEGKYINSGLMEHNCRLLRNYTKCVIHQAGPCPLIRHHYLDIHKFVHPELTREELLQHCHITMDSACNASFSHCFGPLLSSLIDRSTDTQEVQTLLQQTVVIDQTKTCSKLSSLDQTHIQGCLTHVTAGCVYGEVYINTYIDTLTVAQRVKSKMCTQDCSNLSERAAMIQSYCNTAGTRLLQITHTIRESVVYGQLDPSDCSELQRLSNCLSYNAGQCLYLQQLVQTSLFGTTTTSEAMLLCNTQYTAYTGDVTVSGALSTGRQTTPGGHQTGETSSSVIHRAGFFTSFIVLGLLLKTFMSTL